MSSPAYRERRSKFFALIHHHLIIDCITITSLYEFLKELFKKEYHTFIAERQKSAYAPHGRLYSVLNIVAKKTYNVVIQWIVCLHPQNRHKSNLKTQDDEQRTVTTIRPIEQHGSSHHHPPYFCAGSN
jgi:hypothetical protein